MSIPCISDKRPEECPRLGTSEYCYRDCPVFENTPENVAAFENIFPYFNTLAKEGYHHKLTYGAKIEGKRHGSRSYSALQRKSLLKLPVGWERFFAEEQVRAIHAYIDLYREAGKEPPFGVGRRRKGLKGRLNKPTATLHALFKKALLTAHPLLGPESYVEKRRGAKALMLYERRLTTDPIDGRPMVVYVGRTVKKAPPKTPLIKATLRKTSPVNLWWVERMKELQLKEGLNSTEAYREIFNRHKWIRLCHHCRTPLPLGVVFNGQKTTPLRECCPGSCTEARKKARRN